LGVKDSQASHEGLDDREMSHTKGGFNMGVTPFPHGIIAFPNIGGYRAEMFQAGNIFFVDGDNGSSGNMGSTPDDALALPSQAVSYATRGGIVYIRPRSTVASAQSYYIDNITLPLTKPGMQLLGCGDIYNPYMGVDIKALAPGSPVLTVYGSAVQLEGIRFAGTGQTADTASIVDVSNNGTTTRAYGLTVRGCRFANGKGHLISAGAAISIDTIIGVKIQDCIFSDNLAGITGRTNYAAVNGFHVTGCIFEGTPAGRDIDIWITGTGRGVLIDGCKFIDGLPNHGVNNRFIITDTSGITGMLSNCNFAMTGATMDSLIGTAGADAVISTGIFIVNCHGEGSAEGIGICSR
jgi:hypothetical protein